MSLKENNVGDATEYGRWLERCGEGFIRRLKRRGYASETIRVYGRFVGALCTKVIDRRLDITGAHRGAVPVRSAIFLFFGQTLGTLDS